MRKITKREVKKASVIFAEIFNDYDLYDLAFRRDSKRENKISYFFSYEIYSSLNSTYEFDDFKALATIVRPGDNHANPLINPLFSLKLLFGTGLKSIRIGKEYMDFAEEASKKYYNPDTDCYIKNIGVVKEYRGQGYLRKMIDEICGNMPVILETHLETNVSIYEKLGFELLDILDFYGKKHYIMKRKSAGNVKKSSYS